MQAIQGFPAAFQGYVLGYVFVRHLQRAVLLSFVKRAYQTRIRAFKALGAAANEAAESMSALSEALGAIDQDMDDTFDAIVSSEQTGEEG